MKSQNHKFQAIKGVRDILPPESALWNRVEAAARAVFGTYGYGEIRLPIMEQTELFARSVGEETDMVGKEMYTFDDWPNTVEHPRTRIFSSADLDVIIAAMARGELPNSEENRKTVTELRQLLQQMDDEQVRELHAGETQLSWLAGFRRIVSEYVWQAQSLRGQSLALRPEATASVVRAYIEHGMQTRPGNVKLYYIGPMFRRERPQKGRYRQFYQIGAELLGTSDHAALDAEVIEMLMALFTRIGLQSAKLQVNSIGDKNCRPAYVELLRGELQKMREKLGPDSQRRIETNPLRVLDSKAPEEQALIEGLPRIAEHLCAECKQHYAELKRQLALREIVYEENWRLVRGLDYYMRTTFEITAPGLGSQNAICGGGRYDGLVEMLGGPAGTKGIGFAIGTDRVILSLGQGAEERQDVTVPVTGLGLKASVGNPRVETRPYVFLAWFGVEAYAAGVALAQKLRAAGLAVELPAGEMKFGKALNLADRLGARYAVIIGDEELAAKQLTVKRLADGEQKKMPEEELIAYLAEAKAAS